MSIITRMLIIRVKFLFIAFFDLKTRRINIDQTNFWKGILLYNFFPNSLILNMGQFTKFN